MDEEMRTDLVQGTQKFNIRTGNSVHFKKQRCTVQSGPDTKEYQTIIIVQIVPIRLNGHPPLLPAAGLSWSWSIVCNGKPCSIFRISRRTYSELGVSMALLILLLETWFFKKTWVVKFAFRRFLVHLQRYRISDPQLTPGLPRWV